jgi:glycosyltransferase involved in cell wall biosynthesis
MLAVIFTYNRPVLLRRAILSIPHGVECIIFDNGAEFSVLDVLREVGRSYQVVRHPRNINFDLFFLCAVQNLRERGARWCWFIGDDDYFTPESSVVFSADWSEARVIFTDWYCESLMERQREVYPRIAAKGDLELCYSTPRTLFLAKFLGGAFGCLISDVQSLSLEGAARWIGSHHLYSGIIWDTLAKDNSANCLYIKSPVYCRGDSVKTYNPNSVKLNYDFARMFRLFPSFFSREAAYVFFEDWIKKGCPPECREMSVAIATGQVEWIPDQIPAQASDI